MKEFILILLAVSCMLIPPGISHGDHFSDGNQLQQVCHEAIKLFDSTGKADVYDAGKCIGYIRATNDVYEIMAEGSKRTICIPSGISSKQLTRVIAKYLNEHPEKLHNVASLLVLEAFQEYFPCSQAETQN